MTAKAEPVVMLNFVEYFELRFITREETVSYAVQYNRGSVLLETSFTVSSRQDPSHIGALFATTRTSYS